MGQRITGAPGKNFIKRAANSRRGGNGQATGIGRTLLSRGNEAGPSSGVSVSRFDEQALDGG
jgi:hypothetical protein